MPTQEIHLENNLSWVHYDKHWQALGKLLFLKRQNFSCFPPRTYILPNVWIP